MNHFIVRFLFARKSGECDVKVQGCEYGFRLLGFPKLPKQRCSWDKLFDQLFFGSDKGLGEKLGSVSERQCTIRNGAPRPALLKIAFCTARIASAAALECLVHLEPAVGGVADQRRAERHTQSAGPPEPRLQLQDLQNLGAWACVP